MARKPGPMNPDSVAGNARLGVGRGSNAGRSQKSGANKAVPAPKKLQPPVNLGQRAADLMNRGSKAAEARLKAEFKAKGLNWETGLPNNAAAAAKLRAQGAAYRANLKGNRVTELEKRLNFPKKRGGR